jgi:hypothetical protein|nr:hypothetical protein [uncultured Bradyrhizobium sp.]
MRVVDGAGDEIRFGADFVGGFRQYRDAEARAHHANGRHHVGHFTCGFDATTCGNECSIDGRAHAGRGVHQNERKRRQFFDADALDTRERMMCRVNDIEPILRTMNNFKIGVN